MDPRYADIPVLSIVTPSYNQGQFLDETIASVISQEGDFFIDYIIVDGGSTDRSIEIIQQHEERLQSGQWPVRCRGIGYRWLSGRDDGQSDALVKGFDLAEGRILAWINSDDTYLPGAFRAAADFFRAHPDAALLYGQANYTDEAGKVLGRYRTAQFDLEELAAANIICQPASFFRRSAYEAVGGLDRELRFVMDYDLWIRFGKRFPCFHLPSPLATYRLHETSKTVNSETLAENAEESLSVTLRHFGWAPLTRVYTACRIACDRRLPRFLGQSRGAGAAAAVLCTIVRSLRLNRGLRRHDLKLLSGNNLRKLFKTRLEIMTGR